MQKNKTTQIRALKYVYRLPDIVVNILFGFDFSKALTEVLLLEPLSVWYFSLFLCRKMPCLARTWEKIKSYIPDIRYN